MGQAISIALRENIFSLQCSGKTPKMISETLSLPLGTVKQLCRRFREHGKEGIIPFYQNCGQKATLLYSEQKSSFLFLKQEHPLWGAPRLHLEQCLLEEQVKVLIPKNQITEPLKPLPSIRSLNRWYRQAGLTKNRKQTGNIAIGRARATHNIWEIDAKERLILQDGSPACYLTITDEKSGAWLEAPVFPLSPN